MQSKMTKVSCRKNKFYLAAVLCGAHLTETVYFGWNEPFKFWHVDTDSKVQTAEAVDNNLCVPSWRILVYVHHREFVCLLLNGTSALFRPLVPRTVEVEHMR